MTISAHALVRPTDESHRVTTLELEYVADTDHHSLGDALHGLPAWALYGGVATYLSAHIAFRLRNVDSVNVGRLVVAVALLGLVPVAERIPALAALGLLTAADVGPGCLRGGLRFGTARDTIRHAEHVAAAADGPGDPP